MALLFFILTAMARLSPGATHAAEATAIAQAVLESPPLFRDDEERVRTAALVVAIAFRESSFRNDVTSRTHDSCMMQVNRRPDLASDPAECVRVALSMLRESMRACPAYPLAVYAEGPRGCRSPRAQRISRDRMAVAAWLVRRAER